MRRKTLSLQSRINQAGTSKRHEKTPDQGTGLPESSPQSQPRRGAGSPRPADCMPRRPQIEENIRSQARKGRFEKPAFFISGAADKSAGRQSRWCGRLRGLRKVRMTLCTDSADESSLMRHGAGNGDGQPLRRYCAIPVDADGAGMTSGPVGSNGAGREVTILSTMNLVNPRQGSAPKYSL